MNSNLNLASYGIYGNTGAIPQNIEPGIAKAVALVPKGTIIPASAFVSQAALLTYLMASAHGFLADNRISRFFILNNLDTFEDKTKAMGSTDTGLSQFDTIKFNTKYTFRALTNKANHQEMLSFDNSTRYDCYIWDALTNIWCQQDPAGSGGALALSIEQIRIMDFKPATTKDGLNSYDIAIQFANRNQFNENFGIFNTGINSDAINGLMNAVATDVSATLGTPLTITTTTDIVITLKAGQGSIDLASAAFYQTYFTTANKAMLVVTNLTLGTTLTISTLTAGTIVVAGQTYNYLWLVLSAAPTVTNVVQVALAAPSVVNAIVPNFNAVTEIAAYGVNGQNAAVHIF